jgi:hypothetical protein
VDVFRPGLRRVRGFYEHAQRPWQRGIWALRTLWWALLPWRFWRRVSLEHAPVPRRVVTWPLVVAVLLWAAGSLVSNATHLIGVASWSPPPRLPVIGRPSLIAGGSPDVMEIASGWTWPLAGRWPWSVWMFDPLQWLGGSISLIAASAAWPLVLALLARSRREARVRRWHIARAAVYSLAWMHIALVLRLADAVWGLGDLSVSLAVGYRPGASPWGGAPINYFWSNAPLGRVLLLAWLLVWWYWALRRGFRLDRAGTIWALLALISVLVAVIAELSLMPWYLWDILG